MRRPTNKSESVFKVAADIVPIGELKSSLSERIRGLKQRGRPLVITQNGRAAAVLMSPEEFDRLTSQAHFTASVQAGLADLEAGRLVDDEELGRRLDARYASAVALAPDEFEQRGYREYVRQKIDTGERTAETETFSAKQVAQRLKKRIRAKPSQG